MILGLLLSPGDSLSKQKKSGQLDRLIRYYLTPYSKAFNKIYLFTYGSDKNIAKLPSNITLVTKPKLIPYQLYQLLIPFIYKKIINKVNIFRVFQAIGGLPLLFISKPSVVTYGYHYHQFASIENHPIKAKLISLIIKPVLNKAIKIIVTSIENQNYLIKLGYQDKLTLIPNGVDPLVFKPSNARPSGYLILTVGRLTHQKNHQFLIKAISLSRHKSKLRLVIIGKGPLKRKIIKQAEKNNVSLRIIPKLPHNQLVNWYQSAIVFTLTSKIEGQPKVLLEALSSGCACLTTSFPGNLIVNNQNGLIADSSLEFSKKLDKLINDSKLRIKLGTAGRQLIESQFDIKKLVQKEITLLKSCLN
ncbi:glycosyltransferase family 4 protein [Patescibacteria group bacterium]|nr:glycosyltransferase family 4 protein [Patescibacteria group bacterium]